MAVKVGVKVGVYVLVKLGVGLMKYARTDEFEDSNQAATIRMPTTKLRIQKPATHRPNVLVENAGIRLFPVRCGADRPAPY